MELSNSIIITHIPKAYRCQTGFQTVAAAVVAVVVVVVTFSVRLPVAEGVFATPFGVGEAAFAEDAFQNFVHCA